MDGPAEALNIGDPMNSANAIVRNIIFFKNSTNKSARGRHRYGGG